MLCERKSAGACDRRRHFKVTKLFIGLLDKASACFLYFRIMPLIIREEQIVIFIEDSYLNCRGTDVNTKCIIHFNPLNSDILINLQ